MPPGSQFRLRLRRRIEKLRGTIFSFKKHTKDGRCFWAEYFFEVFWRLLLKPKSRKNISSKVGKISNYRPVEGLNSKVRPGLTGCTLLVCIYQWFLLLQVLGSLSFQSFRHAKSGVHGNTLSLLLLFLLIENYIFEPLQPLLQCNLRVSVLLCRA